MSTEVNFYEILGVAEDADTETIKAAYRALAKKYHPDISHDQSTAKQFVLIGRARRILVFPEKRRRYDEQLGMHRRACAEAVASARRATGPEPDQAAAMSPRPPVSVARPSRRSEWTIVAAVCVLAFAVFPRMVFPSDPQPLPVIVPADVMPALDRRQPQPAPSCEPAAATVDARPTAGDANELVLAPGNTLTMKLALIPAGKFMMGSADSEIFREEPEGPQREVVISRPFRMGIHEVTQEQYQAVVGHNPSAFKTESNPVENVSWYEAVEFCTRLSAKTGRTVMLPTEAQWEYACRAGATSPFCTGQTIRCDQANFDARYTYGNGPPGTFRRRTLGVGSFKPNDFGLYDMHGNVWEWCRDWYDAKCYAGANATDPTGPPFGALRVLRGGSWLNSPRDCRCAYRDWCDPCHRNSSIGFRVVVAAGAE